MIIMTQPKPNVDTKLRHGDPEAIRKLVEHCGVFSDEEIAVAGELAELALGGVDNSYCFVFFRDQMTGLYAYSCYGAIPFAAQRYDLYWIAVDPSCQGSGIASAVLAETEDCIRKQGGERLYAETSSTPPYAAARRFYHRHGFVEAARLKDFYQAGDDKLIFEKLIAPR